MLKPLQIGLTPGYLLKESLSTSELETAERELRKAKPTVFTRDDHTCRYCGYREEVETLRALSASSGSPKAKSHLDVVFLDADIRNTSLGNLAMACAFCAPILSINTITPPHKWLLAWAPLLEQSWISSMSRAIMMADYLLDQYDRGNDRPAFLGGYASGLTAMLSKLRDEMHGAHLRAKQQLGFRDFNSFSEAVVQMALVGEGYYSKRHELLKGFVIIPNGLISMDWAGFEQSFEALRTGGPLASVTNIYDVAQLGKDGFNTAENLYRKPVH